MYVQSKTSLVPRFHLWFQKNGKKSISSSSTLSQLLSLPLVQQTRSISSDVSFHTSSRTDTPEDTK